jgi:hypothetical protein
MTKVRIYLFLLVVFFFSDGILAQLQDPETRMDMKNLIRRERLDLILPQAMRNNVIDMWIHLSEGSNIDFGSDGYFVFTDRGGDRIERAVFGWNYEIKDPKIFDIISDEIPEPSASLSRFYGLRQFIAERDPKRIAVDSDNISHKNYLELVDELGDTYAKRMVPAEDLVTDFQSQRVLSELVLYSKILMVSTEMINTVFDKIEPGVTTLKDIAVWLRDSKIPLTYGLDAHTSLGNPFVRHPDGHEDNQNDYIIQRGDLVGIGEGNGLGNFDAHTFGIGYVLKEGESSPPPEVQRIWQHGLKVREILRKNIKSGRTARETLDILIHELENAGYYYNPVDEYNETADPEKTQVHLDLHAMGRQDIPRISPLSQDWALDLKIPIYHTFCFEYMVHMPVPEWGQGKHLYVLFHDGVVVTERGIEFSYPPIDRIRLIR